MAPDAGGLAALATACHVLPRSLLYDNAWGLLAVIALIAVLMVGGSLHYHHKYREELTLRTEKPLDKPLTALVPDTAAFTILLDHQPFHLEEAEQAGVDFQFIGHTHRGQFWPVSWITDAMFEKSWGHHTRGDTRYYISSGLGIWGPKIRIGTRSEYLVLRVDRKH